MLWEAAPSCSHGFGHGHLGELPAPFGLWDAGVLADPGVLPVCCSGVCVQLPCTPWEDRGCVEAADPRLAQRPRCSVTLSSSAKMFHGSDWQFPPFQILQPKLQAEKHHVLMVAGSQKYTSLGKAASISREDQPTSVVTQKRVIPNMKSNVTLT